MGWFEELFIKEAKKALEHRNESDYIILTSANDSGKRFKIAVYDSGNLTATEVKDNNNV